MQYLVQWLCPCWNFIDTKESIQITEKTEKNEETRDIATSPTSHISIQPRILSPYQDFIIDPPSPLSPDSWEHVSDP
jgi:hypothetical protein